MNLETLAGRLLHPEACETPESPPDKMARFEIGCDACMVALKVAMSAPAPPGAFNGWYEERDKIRADMKERGVEL